MSPKRRVTIKDVAEAAGVSTQTVSRVMNNHPDVAPNTLVRVQQVIKDTGYAPNILARSLIRGRSHILGVVAYGLEYYGPSRVLTGIEQQAAETGYSISLNLLHQPETSDVEQLLNSLLARQVDGVVWAIPEIGHNRSWSHNRRLNFPVPIAFISGMSEPAPFSLRGIDNRAIGHIATEHLLAGGAKRVGIITGPLDWWEARQRELGWREALIAHGLPVEDPLIAVGAWPPKNGEQGLYQLLAQCSDLDAVFASNDQMALGVLHAAHRLGRRVPEDLSIVGVDNTPDSAHYWPPLTTVRQRLREAGALIVQEIDALIQMSEQVPELPDDLPIPSVKLLQPELIIRESTRASGPASGQINRDES